MKILSVMSLTAAVLSISQITFSATATPSAAPDQKKQIETVVHDYIVQNPETIIQSLQGYQQKQMVEQAKKFEKIQSNAPKYANELFHQATDPVAGNPNGSVTLVEFFDYQCPHCVEMTPVIEELIKSNPNLRVVFKEFPIRGAMSDLSARATLAAQKQGKYFELHKALMESKTEPLTEQAIYDLAKTAGLNIDKLKADMKDKTVDQQIKANDELAKNLQLMFTPVLFIAKSNVTPNAKSDAIVFIPGRVSVEQVNHVLKQICFPRFCVAS